MCGFCGVYTRDRSVAIDYRLLMSMRESMQHRGPDACGEYVLPGVALGHRRLKIIDLSSAASQPMSDSETNLAIVYNGEVYNFRELRGDLIAQGVSFHSKSDTEVLLRLYQQYGPSMVRKLNGIFSFAIYDYRKDSLFCARDPLGVKPFYYAFAPSAFLFASEIKAILAGGIPFELEADAVGEYLMFHYVSGERTLFRKIRRLLPGHTLSLQRGWIDPRPECYWSVLDQATPSLSRESSVEQLGGILETAVKRQMVSDVPVGTFCSGGLDSSGLTAIASNYAGSPMNTFSVVFHEILYSEASFAKRVSSYCHTIHHELLCTPDDFGALLPTAIWLHDEPLMHPNSIPMYQVSNLAKPYVTVLLSGEGADEIFGGYYWQSRFCDLAALYSWVRWPARACRLLTRRSARLKWDLFLAGFAGSNLADVMVLSGALCTPELLTRLGFRSGFQWPNRVESAKKALAGGANACQARILYDQVHYLAPLLDRQDKMCMGASIESRVPYLDLELVPYVNALSIEEKILNGTSKVALRKVLKPYLPAEILGRTKYGFGIPLDLWFRTEPLLRNLLEDVFHNPKSLVFEWKLLSHAALQDALRGFLNRNEDLAMLFWSLLNLELWLRIFCARSKPWEPPSSMSDLLNQR